ncbi:DUF4338 domain-containing protein [Zavarzinia sp.]|uniref:DUF4338 domain-containing protein n=1 Tax=Zavarzinia sp. TaxID=2027920 RepID=UPI003563BA04
MDALLRYRGRTVSDDDVAFIRGLLAGPSGTSRRKLSLDLCAAWDWRQPNGEPRDAVCRGLLLALARAGHLELPAPRWVPRGPRRRSAPTLPPDVDRAPIAASLAALGPIEVRQVRRTPDEPLFGGLIQEHHYLGYVQPVGEHLKFMAYAGERPVACLAWSSAPRHLGPRDRFIGWSAEARRTNIRFVAYNSRFLILPWVQVPHLASHLLGRMARMLSSEWQQVYGHPVHLLETFVHAERYRGTCYRAANWTVVGRTTGRGKDDRDHRGPNRPVKDVLCYPLVRDFRDRLSRMP